MTLFKKTVLTWAVLCAVVLVTGSENAGAELTKIAEGVYSYVDVKNGSPKNSFGANAGIVAGQDGVVVIDTLISAKEAERFLRDIRLVTDKPIRFVVNTHAHLDHTFGNSHFERLGAVVISHAADAKRMKNGSETALRNISAYGLTGEDMEGTTITYPSITFSGTMTIELDGQTLELIHPGGSHTEGSILVYLPQKKVLFAGDILFTRYHPFIADGDIAGWTAVLDTVAAMEVDAIIPGHGPLSGKKDIEDMRAYLLTFDAKAKELCAKSKDLEAIVSEMKKALPQRPEGEMLIRSNIQMKYLGKQ